jgi:UDP-glucose 4-epimerase
MSIPLVTGGAGFIGSQVVRSLLAQGADRVRVLDNLSSGKRENLSELGSRVELVEADIRDFDRVRQTVEPGALVFHLAAIPSVPRSIHEPVPSHESNIDGTFEVLRACSEKKAGRVVYAASSSAYGNTETLPKVETMRPEPLSPYAAQKLMGEYYCSVFTQCFGLETVSLRFFNVFGPRQDPTSQYSGVLSIFMTRILERRPPTLFGDGGQSRDFTYVEDVADLCLKASRASGAAGRMYNAGNGERYTLNETWKLLCRIEGVEIAPEYGPAREGDVRDSQADTSRAVAELGHAPKYSFEEGLRRTLEWYRRSVRG